MIRGKSLNRVASLLCGRMNHDERSALHRSPITTLRPVDGFGGWKLNDAGLDIRHEARIAEHAGPGREKRCLGGHLPMPCGSTDPGETASRRDSTYRDTGNEPRLRPD